LRIKILDDKLTTSRAAAAHAATSLRRTLYEKSTARLAAATGASQIEFLGALTAARDIDRSRIEVLQASSSRLGRETLIRFSAAQTA
jgi:6-phosphogluconolactonase/glucosamine-6-phosphate isomerase/deaminase